MFKELKRFSNYKHILLPSEYQIPGRETERSRNWPMPWGPSSSPTSCWSRSESFPWLTTCRCRWDNNCLWGWSDCVSYLIVCFPSDGVICAAHYSQRFHSLLLWRPLRRRVSTKRWGRYKNTNLSNVEKLINNILPMFFMSKNIF